MKKHLSCYLLLAMVLLLIHSASAQTTKSININITGSSTTSGILPASGAGSATVNPFGNAALAISSTQAVDSNFNPTGPIQATITFSFNRLDSVTTTATIPSFTDTATFPATISGGKGVYAGASGSGTFTVKLVSTDSAGANLTLSGSGNVKVGQTTTAFTLANASYRASGEPVATISATGTGTVSGANVNLNAAITTTDGITAQGTAVLAAQSGSDSLTVFFTIPNLNSATYSVSSTVTAGTGAYAGATGVLALNLVNNSKTAFALTGSGTLTTPAQGTVRPVITSINTAGSDATFIAPNAWVQIQGTNLVPATTPAAGVIWSNAPEFASNHMPTQLSGISVTVNGKPAYIYFFCSAATSAICKVDQINILTSLDNTVGQVLVVVTNGAVSSVPFIVTMQAASPSFLQWDLTGHPVATHTDSSFSLLGPPGLFPPLTTPARKLEPILVYGDGFGLPAAILVEGSSLQSGVLPNPQPVCTFGTTPVAATVVLVSPGLYGFGLTVPSTAVSGDNPITCTYLSVSTPPGDVINVQ